MSPLRHRAPVILAATGAVTLALGLVVYLADRDTSRSLLIPAAAALSAGPLFGEIGQWLPSFVHPFAFSLFTAAARPPGWPPAYRACAGWWALNVAFEMGQHPRVSAPLAEFLAGSPGDGTAMRWLSNYFVLGVFDAGDLVAVTAGALAAAAILLLIDHRGDRNAS